MYFLRARYMDQNKGRFLSFDSFNGSIENPESLHKYLYTQNAPVDSIDPSGQFSCGEIVAVVAVVSIVAAIATAIYYKSQTEKPETQYKKYANAILLMNFPDSYGLLDQSFDAHCSPQVEYKRTIKENILELFKNKVSFADWKKFVSRDQKWDYKHFAERNKAGKLVSRDEFRFRVDFGNFNFGVTGKAIGLDDLFMFIGAGWAQTQSRANDLYNGYPDDPIEMERDPISFAGFLDEVDDHQYVVAGIEYWKQIQEKLDVQ